jgi:hypothetical protein
MPAPLVPLVPVTLVPVLVVPLEEIQALLESSLLETPGLPLWLELPLFEASSAIFVDVAASSICMQGRVNDVVLCETRRQKRFRFRKPQGKRFCYEET